MNDRVFFNFFLACVALVAIFILATPQWPFALAGLAIVWTIIRFQDGAASLNLIGSGFYGATSVGGRVVTTKWISFFMPFIPVQSYFVPEADSKHIDGDFAKTFTSRGFSAVPCSGIGLHWPSVMLTFGKTVAVLLVFAGVMAIAECADKRAKEKRDSETSGAYRK